MTLSTVSSLIVQISSLLSSLSEDRYFSQSEQVGDCGNNWYCWVFVESDKPSFQGVEVIELSDTTNALHC